MIQGFTPAEADGFARLLAERAKRLRQMLTPDAQARVKLAIKAARDLASKIDERHKEGRAKARRTIPGRGVGKV